MIQECALIGRIESLTAVAMFVGRWNDRGDSVYQGFRDEEQCKEQDQNSEPRP